MCEQLQKNKQAETIVATTTTTTTTTTQHTQLQQEDFQRLEIWNVAPEELLKTREEFRQKIVGVHEQANARLLTNVRRQHREVTVAAAAPVLQPPVNVGEETRKQRRERLRKRKEAAKKCPGADEDTYDIVHILKQDLDNRQNSMNKDFTDQCREQGVNGKMLLCMCKGYRTSRRGKPATQEDALNKQMDEEFLEDYLSGDQQLRKPYLDDFVREMLSTKISMDMFAPENFKRNALKLKQLGDKIVYFENLQKENPEYFEALPQVQKDMLNALIPVQVAFVGLLSSHMDMRGVNYNYATYHKSEEALRSGRDRLEMSSTQLEDALKQFEKDSLQVLQREYQRQLAEEEGIKRQEFDDMKREIEENCGPGQRFEKFAGIHFTNRAYLFQYDLVVEARELLQGHPQEYQLNREIVDQLYSDLMKTVDVYADYYYEGKVIDAGIIRNSSVDSEAPPLSHAIQTFFTQSSEKNQEEASKVMGRLAALKDLMRHYLCGLKLSNGAARILAEYGHSDEAAQEYSKDTSVVKGLTQEQMERSGFVSTHFTMLKQDAQAFITAGNGFLYAKDFSGDLVELRPTLPQTVTIDGKAYRLRYNYNLLIKSIVNRILDRKGNLRADAREYASALSMAFANPSYIDLDAREKVEAYCKEQIEKFIVPTAEQLVDDGDLGDFADQMAKIMSKTSVIGGGACRNIGMFPTDALSEALENFVTRMEKMKVPITTRKEQIRKAMRAQGASGDAIQAKIRALDSLYHDAEEAMKQFRRLKDLDLDGQDVALPNTCVCTGDFYEQIGAAFLQSPQKKLRYDYAPNIAAHVRENPQAIVTYLKRKVDGIEAEGHPLHAQLAQVEEHLKTGKDALTQEDFDFLSEHADVQDLKYLTHVAANVGVMPDGRNLIVESYAPTYSQYTVSPFTTQSAVGVYRDGENGMREYYKHDNPFPDKDEFRLIAETMEELIRGNLPGDQAPA